MGEDDLTRWPGWVARLMAGFNIVIMILGLMVLVRYRAELPEGLIVTMFVNSLGALVYSVLASLILTRQPGHIVGRIMAIVGTVLAVTIGVSGLTALASATGTFSRTALGVFTLAGHLVWPLWLFVPASLMVVYFPDGRLPSRRWWPVPTAAVLVILYLEAWQALEPWTTEEMRGAFDVDNPLAVPGSERFFESLSFLVPVLAPVAIFGAAAAVFIRFRRARGAVRAQMKWLVYAVAMWVAMAILIPQGNDVWESILLNLWPTTLASAIGIAILRHNLFDIDVIIRRTVQYALVSGLLAGVYFGLVIMLTTLLTALGAPQSELVTVVATLAVAALFAPLRRRVQDFVDRRFFRRKYDAAQLLAQFAASARDEADLERVSAEMLRVTSMAMQPEHVSLWLKDNVGEQRY